MRREGMYRFGVYLGLAGLLTGSMLAQSIQRDSDSTCQDLARAQGSGSVPTSAFQNPPTPFSLSPLSKGGEGEGSGGILRG